MEMEPGSVFLILSLFYSRALILIKVNTGRVQSTERLFKIRKKHLPPLAQSTQSLARNTTKYNIHILFNYYYLFH